MAKTRPGIDRITYQMAQAAAILGEQFLTGHMKHCPQCHTSGTDLRKRCGVWWKMAVRVHTLRRKLRQWNIDSGPPQPTLFDI
jgi:hypothetical protein